VALILANASTARAENENELAEGLDALAEYIHKILHDN
jgi:hypothetical protein